MTLCLTSADEHDIIVSVLGLSAVYSDVCEPVWGSGAEQQWLPLWMGKWGATLVGGSWQIAEQRLETPVCFGRHDQAGLWSYWGTLLVAGKGTRPS